MRGQGGQSKGQTSDLDPEFPVTTLTLVDLGHLANLYLLSV